MTIKIVKAVRAVGHATFEGMSFPEKALFVETKNAFDGVADEVRRMNAMTTGPATIKILVEQEVIVNDE